MLKDKVAVVTGAGRGIGREIAKTFAGYGAKVVVNFNGSEERANSLVEEVKAAGGEAVAFKANVADFAEAEALMKFAVATYGRIDILVNNAGITRDNLVLGMKEADFDDVININLKGTFNCIKHVYRTMMKQKYGRIINMSSVVGIEGNAGQVNYAASKAGVIGITKSIAKELGSRGITANAIAPGFIKTDMTDALSDKAKEAMLDHITVKRLGEVSDIAETAAFLASDNASYITGQVIKVDGGMSL
ncbi:3-oxoacyl-[acyl-carrier-protein] reductase [Coprococcus sp. AM14-16]|uniref:3-oxoacyl-[acyl-carrier-protein] reductase n=1 Tax=Coprococcus TaxID=33042 RepID=UPI000E3FFA8D|nr:MULTISPECIES: 3-oxoacyl-[acyl-carrier-protein] reductase [Coprococcus]RGD40183.1 3-oxoacyl-[acyl-carrier-protein] reductase [Coprococcus sp. AM14-16]